MPPKQTALRTYLINLPTILHFPPTKTPTDQAKRNRRDMQEGPTAPFAERKGRGCPKCRQATPGHAHRGGKTPKSPSPPRVRGPGRSGASPLSRRKGTRASETRSQGHAGGDEGQGGLSQPTTHYHPHTNQLQPTSRSTVSPLPQNTRQQRERARVRAGDGRGQQDSPQRNPSSSTRTKSQKSPQSQKSQFRQKRQHPAQHAHPYQQFQNTLDNANIRNNIETRSTDQHSAAQTCADPRPKRSQGENVRK